MKEVIKSLRMHYLQTFRYRLIGCGSGTYVSAAVRIRPNAIRIGSHSFIGPECWLASRADIGNWVMLAGRVALVGGDHRIDKPGIPAIESGRDTNQTITIGDDVWIGYGSILLHGIRIGEGSVIGAGSVVTKDVQPYSIVAGVPARVIRMRFDQKLVKLHGQKLDQLRKQLGFDLIRGCNASTDFE